MGHIPKPCMFPFPRKSQPNRNYCVNTVKLQREPAWLWLLWMKHALPEDLYRRPVAVPATTVFNSSSTPLPYDNSTPNTLYIRAGKAHDGSTNFTTLYPLCSCPLKHKCIHKLNRHTLYNLGSVTWKIKAPTCLGSKIISMSNDCTGTWIINLLFHCTET